MRQILLNNSMKIIRIVMKEFYLELIYLDMDRDYTYMEEIVWDRQHSKPVHFVPYKVQIYEHYDRVLIKDHLQLE
jgi:hypothetical protein